MKNLLFYLIKICIYIQVVLIVNKITILDYSVATHKFLYPTVFIILIILPIAVFYMSEIIEENKKEK